MVADMKYARYLPNGEITGFYDSDEYPIKAGEPRVIELTEAEYEASAHTKYIVEGGVLAVDWKPFATLAERQEYKVKEINRSASVQYNVTQDTLFAHFERGTWGRQQMECDRWFSAEPSDRVAALVPWCAICADERGIALDDFMERVKARIEEFFFASAKIAGKRQRLTDEIYACEDTEEGRKKLDAISWGGYDGLSLEKNNPLSSPYAFY